MPAVSVIVPNYNHAPYLKQRLDSILNQTYQDIEIIILDDCSTDNSKEIIENYRKNKKVSNIIYNVKNSGTSYKQWYRGIEYAKCELIWIAESDDWCDERFLEILVPHFIDKEVALAFVNTLFVYSGDQIERNSHISLNFEKIPGIDFIRKRMLIGNGIDNASMVVFRKDGYLNVKDKGYRNLKLCGDWLLWIHLINGCSVVNVHEALNFCRRHNTNTASRFTSEGLDFSEAVKVLRIAKKFCNYDFDRIKVYSVWLERYYYFRDGFNKGVRPRLFLNLLRFDPLMFIYFIFKLIYNRMYLSAKKIKRFLWRKRTDVSEVNRISR